MAKYSYCRVSSESQHLDRQEYAMTLNGISPENIFMEKLSGKDMKRPQLQAMLTTVQSGDTLVVESISRIARNTRDLLDIVEQLTAKGVEFISLKEQLDTTSPTGKFVLTMFAALYELERSTLLDRQREGIAAAKRRGVKFGRTTIMPSGDFAAIVRRWERGELTFADVLAQTGLKQATFYNRLREFRATRGKK
ncbi:integrase [Clostridia bacterium]|nr:integrase [Clostridia bacterium]